MSDIWLDSVDMDGISLLGHSPNHVSFDGYATLSARLFVVNDGTDAGPMFPFEAAHAFGILMGVEDNFAGPGYEWQAYFDFVQKPFPGNPFDDWTAILQPDTTPSPSFWVPIRQTEAAGNNGAAYFGGGTVSVTKDYALSRYVFVTPLGSVTVPFVWLQNQPPLRPFWTPSDTPLYAVGIGHALAYDDTGVTNEDDTRWHNFYTRQNSVIVSGAALTAADPGSWDSPFISTWFAVPGGGNYHRTGVLIPSSSGQEVAGYRTEFTAPPFPAQVYQATSEQRYIMPGGFRARIEDHDRTKVLIAYSDDGGHTLTESTIHTLGGANFIWPTLAVDPHGRILATWQNANDQTLQYWTISETFGRIWPAATVAAYAPPGAKRDVHRVRFHPETGLLYHLFWDVLDQRFKISGEESFSSGGFTAAGPWSSPVTVSMAASGHWPVLFPDVKGNLYARWSEETLKGQVSETLGATWPLATAELGMMGPQPSVWLDAATGFHYLLYQDLVSGDLRVYPSDDLTNTAAAPGGTAITGVEQQYAAVVTDARGRVYVFYQALSGGFYQLRCRRSEDLGLTWVTP
jgi:hypothetical protein